MTELEEILKQWQDQTRKIVAAHATPALDFEDLQLAANAIAEYSRSPAQNHYISVEDLTEEDEVDAALIDDNNEVDEDVDNSRALQNNVEAALAEELEDDMYADLYRDAD